MSDEPVVIGVDGGGTKTVAWVAAANPAANDSVEPLGRGESGPANPASVGIGRTLTSIETAINDALSEANRPIGEALSLGIGLAGISAESRSLVASRLKHHAAGEVLVTNDAEPLLFCGTPDGVGIGLIAGTGSFALGKNAAGEMASVGGWGYRFGDEGSAYQIAMSSLRAVTRELDGMGPKTRLTQAVFDWFQIKEPRELIAAVYAPEQDRHTLARLAEVVTELGVAGDPVAATIVEQAAASLTELVAALWQRLQLRGNAISVAATGGVIVNSEYYQQQFEAELQRSQIEARVNYVRHPVVGAIQIARQLLGST